jgi:predicted DNA-binding transcriptional regulator AlpA
LQALDSLKGREMPKTSDYLTPAEVAEILGVSERTLNRWHSLRQGPPRCKIGRAVRYLADSVAAWMTDQEVQPLRSFKEAA